MWTVHSQVISCFAVREWTLQCLVCLLGVSFLEGKEDIMEDWRKKFLNTYKVRAETGYHSMFFPLKMLVAKMYCRLSCGMLWQLTCDFSNQNRRSCSVHIKQFMLSIPLALCFHFLYHLVYMCYLVLLGPLSISDFYQVRCLLPLTLEPCFRHVIKGFLFNI